MKRKLKDIQKGDWIALLRESDNQPFPWQVINIKFQDKKVRDMTLRNTLGQDQYYGYLDWNIEVTVVKAPENDICPCCGQVVFE